VEKTTQDVLYLEVLLANKWMKKSLILLQTKMVLLIVILKM